MWVKINKKELLPGLVLVAIGGFSIIGSMKYTVGSLARMGPGYYPLSIGVIITLLGLMLLFKLSNKKYPQEETEKVSDDLPQLTHKKQLITWLLIVVAVVLFIVLSQYGGLVPATFF